MNSNRSKIIWQLLLHDLWREATGDIFVTIQFISLVRGVRIKWYTETPRTMHLALLYGGTGCLVGGVNQRGARSHVDHFSFVHPLLFSEQQTNIHPIGIARWGRSVFHSQSGSGKTVKRNRVSRQKRKWAGCQLDKDHSLQML